MTVKPDDRLQLNASLDGLLRAENIEQNIAEVDEILRNYASSADEIKRRQERTGGAFQDQLEILDLNHVGRYTGERQIKKDYLIISFTKESVTIEFYYKKTDQTQEDFGRDVKKAGMKINDSEKRAIMDNMLKEVMSGSPNNRSFSETILDHESRTLRSYKLEKVDIAGPIEIGGYAIPRNRFFERRATIYRASPDSK